MSINDFIFMGRGNCIINETRVPSPNSQESKELKTKKITGVKSLLHNGVSCGAGVPVVNNGQLLHHIAHVAIHLAVAQVPRNPPEEPILV